MGLTTLLTQEWFQVPYCELVIGLFFLGQSLTLMKLIKAKTIQASPTFYKHLVSNKCAPVFPQSLISLEESGAVQEQLHNLPPTERERERDADAGRFMRRPGSQDNVQLLFLTKRKGLAWLLSLSVSLGLSFSNSNFPHEQARSIARWTCRVNPWALMKSSGLAV